MKDQNRIELLRNLYRAGQKLRQVMVEQRAGGPRRGLAGQLSIFMLDAINAVEQAVEAIAATGMFEPVSDAAAAQRLQDALDEKTLARVYQDALLPITKEPIGWAGGLCPDCQAAASKARS
jgi:hypothetical protein